MLRSHDRGRVARPALARGLARALDDGALMLVASAGSGKTTALAEALELQEGTAAWVHCSEADRDAGRLLSHVFEALRHAAPGVADAFADRLAAGSEQVEVSLATRQLVAELERLLVDPLTIIIDDAEQLERSPEAVGVVSDLLAAESARLRVALATRRPLPLRTAKLHAAGRLTELGGADLAFSPAECADLLRKRRGGSRPRLRSRRSGPRPRDGRSALRSPSRRSRVRPLSERAPKCCPPSWSRSFSNRWTGSCATG